jgi:HEAT repeat protein
MAGTQGRSWRPPWWAAAGGLALGALIITAAVIARAQAGPPDPVEALRRTLEAPCVDAAARDRATRACLAALARPGDLRRAAVLAEWRDRPGDEAAAVDRANRAEVVNRFTQAVRDGLQHGDPAIMLVTIDLLAETAAAARAHGPAPDLARPFAPDLAALVVRGPPAVRAAAARLLGQVGPPPDGAVPPLGELLQAADPALRRAAAEGLAALIEAVAHPAEDAVPAAPGRRGEFVRMAAAVLPAVRLGLGDWHPEVRRRCVRATGQAAAGLARLLAEPPPPTHQEPAAPPPQAKADEGAELRPLALALRDQGPALAHALRDPDAEVRLQAQKALEELAHAHHGWARAGAADNPLLEGLRAAVPALADAVGDPDLRVRRAALDVLELLGPLGSPAAPALAQALNDRDRFVRWSAVRTLSGLGPDALPWSAPGLTRLLDDTDLDVRLAAAGALERLAPAGGRPVVRTVAAGYEPASPLARTALPALVRSLRAPDAEMRVAALRTLRSLNADARPALPALCEALSDPDERVRRFAAEVLGGLGPDARDAVGELRQALADRSPAVRRAAGDALLNILTPPR